MKIFEIIIPNNFIWWKTIPKYWINTLKMTIFYIIQQAVYLASLTIIRFNIYDYFIVKGDE